MPDFGERLERVFAASGHLCVGIDAHPYLLETWGLPDSPAGLREFGLRVVDAAAGTVGIIKPQVAFFERHGSGGFAVLEAVLAAAREAGLLVIADAKRGDLGTTVEAYGQAWLVAGSPLEADAVTLSPYLGLGSLEPAISIATANGKGVFVLAATSNPEGFGSQRARTADGRTVAAGIVEGVKALGDGAGLGAVGVVIGATVAVADFGIEPADLAHLPILAPGFGYQGARVAGVARLFGPAAGNVVVAASRSILDAGPDGVGAAIVEHARELAVAYGS